MGSHIVTEFAFGFPDKVGVLAAVGIAFAEANINMVGMLNVSQGSTTTTRIVVNSNEAQAREILERNGAEHMAERAVLAVSVGAKAGSLAAVADILAAEDINIGDMYATEGTGDSTTVIMNTSDNLKAAEVIGK